MSIPTHRTLQRRHYSVVPDRIDEFLQSWASVIPALRRKYGFTIESATIDRDSGAFVWLLSVPGDRAAFATAERAYYSSPEKVSQGEGLPPTLLAANVGFVDDVTP